MSKIKVLVVFLALLMSALLLSSCDIGDIFNPGADGTTAQPSQTTPGGDSSEDTDGKCTHKFGEWEVILEATCTQKGKQIRVCSLCMHIENSDTEFKAHTIETLAKVEPTCEAEGKTEGEKCSVCQSILKAQEPIPTLSHNYDKGVCTMCGAEEPGCNHTFGGWNTIKNATCVEEGSKERLCALCGGKEQAIIPTAEHTEVIDQAVEPTCTETGLTEGKHCSACDQTLVAQQEIKATGHAYINGVCHCGEKEEELSDKPQFVVSNKDAKCGDTIDVTVVLKNNPGISSIILSAAFESDALTLTEVVYNTSMGGQTVQPQNMNSPVKLYWINGFSDTEGDFVLATLKFIVNSNAAVGDHNITLSYNADDVYDISETNLPFEIVNGKVTVIANEPDCKHTYGEWNTVKNATCTEEGVKERSCTLCGEKEQEGIAIAVHTEVIDKAVEATCTETGLTEGKHCLVCKTVLIEQQTVKAKGHTEVIDNAVESTCTEPGLTEGKHCSICNIVLVEQNTVKEKGHTYVDGVCHCGRKDENYDENLQYSEGLEYFLSVSGKNYVVEGIGQCKDKDIIIPPEYNGLPVTGISGWAFDGNTEITSVTFPDTFDHIWEYAFSDCTSLTTINIPKNITRILPSAFSGCYNITTYNVHKDNTVYHSVNNCIIETQSKTLLLGCQKSVIPTDGSVTQIGEYAFMGCINLQKLVIPNSITSIGYAAFSGCSGLSEIRISDNLATIKTGAFSGCEKISALALPDSLIEIGSQAFLGCKSLKELVIPIKVTTIGEYAFSNCHSLESVSVVDGNVFYHDESNCLIETQSKTLLLGCKNSIIPNDGSVTSIGNSAFKGCLDLSSILIPSSITVVEQSAFEGCTSLESIQLPDGILSIEGYTFKDCINLSQIILPDSVQEIDTYSFYNCMSLEAFKMPASVTVIHTYTFMKCENLRELTLSTGIKTIETYAFKDLLNLTKINYLGSKQQWNKINKESRWDYNTGGISVVFNYNGTPVTKYTVIFKDYDETVLKEQTVKSGESATSPVVPTRTGYRFVGWDQSFSNVTSDLTVTAKYVQQFTVAFKDFDGTVLKTEVVDINTNATPPEDPARDGYEFTGWDKSFSKVISDITVTAMYEKISTEPQFVVTSKDAKRGDTIEVTVSLKNNPGIASIILSVAFDSNALTLTEVAYNTSIGGQTVQPQNMNSPVKLYWINGFADAEGDFVLVTLKFTVKSNATVGDHNITLSYNTDDVYDISETNLPFEIVNGKITVKQ